ncbi:hypothetical protein ACHRV1_25215 [Flavobacterium aquidurense]|uniref:Trypsin-like peptidase domain-containing protein n=2 Tax=Flavobacterium TaxID=237 RepID=A0A7W7IX15_9FLAO|nr:MULTISPECIES: hypothetical protein [Flavobacterium]MBB4801702.1 hypothetical protein [Flavobacterium nitrogenifigens]MBB6386660.1 hypothetical protein [Flavobacterium notoginsengisoli]
MSNLIEKKFQLTEVLVKTTYQIAISKENSFESKPLAFGAGFFINYKNNLFFVTADHNIHIEDHEINARTGVDNFVGIFNNISNKENFSTVMTPIGGFYYMESFDISKKDLNFQLIDVAVSLVDNTKFEAPFLTDEGFRDENGNFLVAPHEQKFEFLDQHIVEPTLEDTYYVYGKIKPTFKGLFLHRENTFKNNLKYIDTYGRYMLLNTEEEITDSEDWAGLSGSPVLNQNLQCIGVLCSVNAGTKSVFVKPFSEITPLFDTIILENQFKKERKNESI